MAILLSSANGAVIARWSGILDKSFEIEKTHSLSEVKKRCTSTHYDAVLLHRMLIDSASFAGLRAASPMARFFLLSDRPDEEEALSFLRMGIVGYGNTYISPPRLIEALRIITNGGVWLGQKVIQRLITDTVAAVPKGKGNGEKVKASSLLDTLTKAERQIAECIAHGKTNLEIAADLNITERTVKAHLTSIYEKTKTGNRLNLALLINLGRVPQV